MSQEISEKTFRVDLPARLSVSNIRGSIIVRSVNTSTNGKGNELTDQENLIKVKAVKHLDSGSAEYTTIEMVQEADGHIAIKTRYQENGWWSWFFFGHRPCKVDYTIEAPATCDLEVKCVSSSAQVEGIKGDVFVKTVSGKVILQQIQGHIETASVSGRIDGETLAGFVFLDTVSGNIHLKECDLKSAEIKSISANLVIQSPLTQGPYHFKSVSGNVRLVVPPQTGCEVRYKHISGRFECDLPLAHRSFRSGALSAQVQSGGAEVSFRTTSGKLQISLAQGSYSPAMDGKTSAEKNRRILEKVAHGELSAEEGLKALD